jgi:RNA polymerase sigma factor (sigma-70 family)
VHLPPFQTLLDAHGREVHRFLVATVGRVDADDCYQETWLSALRAYPRLDDPSNLRSWIFTVAHHKAIDHLRSRARRPVPVADPAERSGQLATNPAQGLDSASALDPASALDSGGELWARVRELPEKQRTAVALRFVADAAYAEISSVMGTTQEAARRNVHEGLKRLRLEYQL